MAELAPYALLTLEQIRSYFAVSQDEEPQVISLINAASLRAEKIARRKLKARLFYDTLDGHGDSSIILPDFPVVSIDRLSIDEARGFGPEMALDPGEYYLQNKTGIITLLDRQVPDKPGIIQADYTAGIEPVPEDLQLAVAEIVEWSRGRFMNSLVGTKSRRLGGDGVVEDFEIEIPRDAYRAIVEYREV